MTKSEGYSTLLNSTDTQLANTLRDIFEEPLFSENLWALAIPYERLDMIMESVSFTLARDPQRFQRISGTSLSAITVELYDALPSVRFLFVYDDQKVTLVGIDFGARAPRMPRN
jgi:hypothetical protein